MGVPAGRHPARRPVGFVARACGPGPAERQRQRQRRRLDCGFGVAGWLGRTRRKPILGGSMAPSMAPTVLPSHPAPPLTDPGASRPAPLLVGVDLGRHTSTLAWMRAKRSAFDFDFLLIFRGGRTRKLSEVGRGGFAGVSAPWMARLSPQGRVHGVPREPTPPGQARLLIYAINQPRHEGLSRWPSPSPRARPVARPGSVPRCRAGTPARPSPVQ